MANSSINTFSLNLYIIIVGGGGGGRPPGLATALHVSQFLIKLDREQALSALQSETVDREVEETQKPSGEAETGCIYWEIQPLRHHSYNYTQSVCQ